MNRDTLHPDPFDGGSPADAGTATPARGLDDSIPDDASRRLAREVAAAGIQTIDVSAPDLGAVAGALIGRRDALLAEVKALVAQAERIGMDRVNAVLEAAGMDVHLGSARTSVSIIVPNLATPAARTGKVPPQHVRWVAAYLKAFPQDAGLDAVSMYRDFEGTHVGPTPLTYAQFDAALYAFRVQAAQAVQGRA